MVMEIAREQQTRVILFDDEAFIVDAAIPDSMVEVWWSSLWVSHDGSRYETCLECDPRYGWCCYGHEL